MFERFAAEARTVVVLAQEEACSAGSDGVDPVHLLVALAAAPGPAGPLLAAAGVHVTDLRAGLPSSGGGALDAEALAALGIDLDRVRAAAEAAFGPGALDRGSPGRRRGHLRFASGSREALKEALRAAIARGDRVIDGRHLLAGVLEVGDPAVSAALARAGADVAGLRRRLAGEADAA
ncbi:Clp protease N-terminal domain-containing protein [Geodermatophilus arenarius]|uniref:Clp protease N-terminal domain-containing protein n=1 Tax=Geodermatophilus arenarius TaxID=1137990 RepID=A0ABV9LD54_9ACTN